MNYIDIKNAREEAKNRIILADAATRDAAKLVAGRLKISRVDAWTLEELKRELKNYNIHTGRWKD